MVRKKLAVAILAFGALQSDLAGALGLGSLTIKSALNQPLNAEIRLLDAADLDANQVKIQLAAPEDFQRAGVDRDFFLTNLQFSVELDGRGGGVIRVTTREPVVEPYLNFVLETRWPTGRLLREYALLLDPPTFSANGPAAVNPAAGGAPAPRPTRRLEPPTVTREGGAAAPAPVSNTLPEATRSGEYRIQVSDTLSRIAGRHKPAGDVSLEQTMIAIQRANPQVFIRNNINLIKSGYVLRLPSADEVRAVDAGEASRAVQEQTHHWRRGTTAAAQAPASGPQLDASAGAGSEQSGPSEQARLSIAAPGNADKGGAGEGRGKGVEALRGQLTAAQENLEKGQRENKELQSRLDDMERQIATLQRLIALKDDQLAALQVKEAAAAKTDGQAAPQPAQGEARADAAAPEQAAAPAAADAQAAAPQPQAMMPKPAAKPAPKPKPKPVAPAPEAPGLLDQLTSNPLYAAAGVGALALLGGLLVLRRRRAAAAEGLEALAELDNGGEALAFEDNFELENLRISDDAISRDEPAPPEPEAQKPQALRPETGDPIAEADIYIAYGRYQQAVDLLSTAIDAEPARSDLRVKLLEVYLEMRDRNAFQRQYAQLQALGDESATAQIAEMLSGVDGVADWLDQPGRSESNGAALAAAAATSGLIAHAAVAQPEQDRAPAVVEQAADNDVADAGAVDDTTVIAAADDELVFDLDLDDDASDLEATALVSDLPDLEGALDTNLADLSLDLDDLDDIDITDAQAPRAESAAADEAADVPELEIALDDLPGQPVDAGLELDLGQDDLDLALNELGEAGELEDLAAAIGEVEEAPAAESSVALDGLGDLELGAGPGLDVPELEPLADLEALDDLGDLGAADFDIAASETAEPETVEEFDFLADADEVATKLDLARAYIDMGDTDGARDILDEVLQEGSDGQKQEASTLLARIA